MPKKAIWVKSHLRDGVTVQGHLRLVEYTPRSSMEAGYNAAKRVALKLRALADEDDPGIKAAQVAHEEWMTFRSSFKNKIRRYTNKTDETFEKHESLPIEGLVSVPSGAATFVDTIRDFSALGALNAGAVVAAGGMAFALMFLPVATYANNRIANYSGTNPLITIPQKLFKPYTGENKFRKWLNRPEIARSIVNGSVGVAGTTLAVMAAAPIAPIIAGLTVLEVFHEHAIARDAQRKVNKTKWSPARKWINEPKTLPRVLATASAGTAAFTLGAPLVLIGAAAFTSYQLQKWLQRTKPEENTTETLDGGMADIQNSELQNNGLLATNR
jgi:hypothetical protein